ncbi:MAG: ABC transporter substrate-binding protein [Xanthobacteraceae bacterium]|jgi:putative ABC transport system substrate-binding protein
MKRREFITLLGAAVTWPLAARAQQPAPVVGFMHSGTPGPYLTRMANAFSEGLKAAGYVEGRNVTIEYRWAEDHYDRLPALAAELVARRVAVIFAPGGPGPARAAMAVTTSVPIVFVSASDPVGAGLVASLNRPGGNVTGASMMSSTLEAKRLELLHELMPKASTLAVLINPNYPDAKMQTQDVRDAAVHLGVKLVLLTASTEHEIEPAFAALAQQGAGGLLVVQDPIFVNYRERFATLAAANAIPVVYSQRDYVSAGGLISYGPDFADGYRQAASYVSRILKGEKPADLPVVQPTKFNLVINLKTAKTLGIAVPQTLQVAADEVIE